MLETVKRGEDDIEGEKTTVVLRLFEQYGGHAKATLRM
jgi:alpha-mannosidase